MELEEIINKLENQLKEEKNKNYNLIEKNNTLDTKIKELQSKINQQNNLENEINILNTKLKEENKNNHILMNENSNLKKKIEELQKRINEQNNNLMNKNNLKEGNDIIKLYKRINNLNERLKRYPIILEENEKLISIIFTSVDQKTHYSLICKNTDTINKIEAELYKEYPDYSETDNYFLCKGKTINKFQTFERNHIKNGDIIILNQKES